MLCSICNTDMLFIIFFLVKEIIGTELFIEAMNGEI